jgi:NADH-quinone oxidoreductase subunit I
MFGSGLLKGLGITLQHLRDTYVDDRKEVPSRYENSTEVGNNRRIVRQPGTQEGILTLQYPEEKRQLPERFRYIPMLLFDTQTNEDRCTACGICAKVCPPQCIWIVRDADENGKPVTRPAEFYIDATICMSCSFCTEFCPFDAIRMNHDYELSVFDRYPQLIYDKVELTVPLEYYAALWPTQFAEEQERRAAEEAAAAAKAEAKAKADAEKKASAAAAKAAGDAETPVKPKRSAADVEAMKKQAQERAAAAKARTGAPAEGAEGEGGAAVAAAATDEAAAKQARIEELKRKAQESAKARAAGADTAAEAPSEAPAAPSDAATDEAAAKKARIEELKRKAQEAAAKRKESE